MNKLPPIYNRMETILSDVKFPELSKKIGLQKKKCLYISQNLGFLGVGAKFGSK